MRKANFRDYAAKVRVGVVKRTYNFYHFAVTQTEASKVFVSFQARKPLHQPIVLGPKPEHDAVFLACFLNCQNDWNALLPLFNHRAQQLWRVLQVRKQEDDRIPAGLKHPVHWRTQMAE